jgi:signal peptidase I
MMKKRNAFLAAIATIGTFGLGQLYNGKPKKAAVAYILWLATAAFGIFAPLSASFTWLVISLALLLLLGLILMIDAIRDARRLREITLHRYNRWYIYLVIILFQTLGIRSIQVKLLTASTAAYRMTSGSMIPTLEIGERIVADMKAYDRKLPTRGAVIIAKYPKDESVSYIKRVIGLPGEKLEIIGRTVYINGRPLAEEYTQYIDPGSTDEHFGPYILSNGEYFVMGDNRDNSQDSRYLGPVNQSQILGQARYLYWATDLSRIGKRIR